MTAEDVAQALRAAVADYGEAWVGPNSSPEKPSCRNSYDTQDSGPWGEVVDEVLR